MGPLGGRARGEIPRAPAAPPPGYWSVVLRLRLGPSEIKCPKQPPVWLRHCPCGRGPAVPGEPGPAHSPPAPGGFPGEPGPCRLPDPDGLPGGRGRREARPGGEPKFATVFSLPLPASSGLDTAPVRNRMGEPLGSGPILRPLRSPAPDEAARAPCGSGPDSEQSGRQQSYRSLRLSSGEADDPGSGGTT
jgi:hypothetical protein